MTKSLLENANSKKVTAQKILHDANIFKLFSQLGKVEVVGSLKLDLMYRNDIDILVISETIDNSKAIDITNILLKSKQFRTVGFADYHNYPKNDLPLGYYWELIILNDNQEWKFDIWYLRPDEEYTKLVLSSLELFEKVLKKSPSKREVILKIKKDYFNGVKYKDNVKSIDIYRAVLESNVNTIDEFRKYINK